MRAGTFRSKRWLAAWLQAVVMFGLPFVSVRGESALRFDVPSLKLYFFGSVIWISEAYFYLLVFLLFFVGVMLFTVLYGRIWCGWACPQTVLSDFSRVIRKAANLLSGHRIASALVSHALLILFSAVVAANLVSYFVSPYDIMENAATGAIGPWTSGSWLFFTVLLYLDLSLVRQRFCGAVCPYARLQSAFFDQRSLSIAFDKQRFDECLGCEACVRSCPAGIDIRNGLQVECVNCAECIDACSRIMRGTDRKPLVAYTFGKTAVRSSRPRVIGLSALFAALVMLFAYQIHTSMPFDFWVVRDESQTYHQIEIRSELLNAFNLLVENRSLDPAEYVLTVTGVKDPELVMQRNPFILPANSAARLRVFLFVEVRNLSDRVTRLQFVLQKTANPEIRIVREAAFIYPERSDRGVEI